MADQGLEPRRELRFGDELPCPRHASQPVTAVGRFVFLRQLFESRGQLLRFYLLQGAGGFIAAGVLDSRRKNVAEFFQAQRFLRRKQNRFQNGFQIHA